MTPQNYLLGRGWSGAAPQKGVILGVSEVPLTMVQASLGILPKAPFWILLSYPFSPPMTCLHPLFLSPSPLIPVSPKLMSADRPGQEPKPPTQKRLGRKKGSGPELAMD